MPDFTGTDIDGNEIHLYDILDAGQAVLINFFLTGDPYSEAPMTDIIEAYRLYGCNTHDVFFMEICPSAGDANCQAWVDRFDVQYPTISRDGGGNDIAQAIPVGYYPTLMLIRPDHTFAMRDIYPPTLEYIINAMDAEGYEQHECPVIGELVMSTDTIYIDNQGCYVVPGEITITNMSTEAVQILEYTSDEFTLYCHEGEDPYYGNLPSEKKVLISKLTAILRIADAMDSSHRQKISKFNVHLQGDELNIICNTTNDCSFEKWSFDHRSDLFEEVIGIKAILKIRRQV